jgi:hypothetical protein
MTQDQNNQIAKDLSNDPLERIKQLEQLQIETENQAATREKELLLEITKRVEDNKDTRKEAAVALRAKEVAEFKYINQQKAQIDGISNLLNPNETDPDRVARKIFVDRLRHRRETSQELQKNKQDNIYFL